MTLISSHYNTIQFRMVILIAMLLMPNIFYSQTFCDQVGISNGWMLNKTTEAVDEITLACATTKAKYFRMDCAWTDVQYEGENTWNWENTDRVIESALNQNLEVIAIVDYFPPWADASTDTSYWSNFVYEAGLRYIPQGVHVWELWNEPNITNFWPGLPNVESYVNQILIPGSNAIRRAAADLDTTVVVLTAGLAPAASDGTNISQIDFFTGIYTYGGKDYFDAVGHHPYCWPLDPETLSDYNWFLKTEDLRAVMLANNDADKLIWGTELGWPSNGPEYNGVSLSQQAQYLSSAYERWQAWDWTGPLIWYAYNDAGTDITDTEDNFGLVDASFNPKPSLAAFQTVVSACIDASTSTSNDKIDALLNVFPNPSHDQVYINAESNSLVGYQLYDLSGNTIKIDKHHNRFNISTLANGIYVLKIKLGNSTIVKKLVKI